MKTPPRAVLDSNVVLSALLFPRGQLAALRFAWQQGTFLPVIAKPTVEELIRALSYPKFRLSAHDCEELLADYLPFCASVALPTRLPEVPACRDPSDTIFLQLAVCARADYLVTGDRDLLILPPQPAYSTVAPRQFLDALVLRPGGGVQEPAASRRAVRGKGVAVRAVRQGRARR